MSCWDQVQYCLVRYLSLSWGCGSETLCRTTVQSPWQCSPENCKDGSIFWRGHRIWHISTPPCLSHIMLPLPPCFGLSSNRVPLASKWCLSYASKCCFFPMFHWHPQHLYQLVDCSPTGLLLCTCCDMLAHRMNWIGPLIIEQIGLLVTNEPRYLCKNFSTILITML